MNSLLLVWHYLKARPLNTVINVLLMSLGIAVITLLLLFTRQFQQNLQKNARGIDLVAGAKGSPLQLILSTVFHADFPTGNIPLSEAERLRTGRLIREVIPLALGDSYRGYRIVGTSRAYANLYAGALKVGAWWDKPMEVTAGSVVAETLNFRVGDTFSSAHGLMEGGADHEAHPFVVSGILQPTGTVLDKLLLTSVESIWQVHDEHGPERDSDGEQDTGHGHEALVHDSTVAVSPIVPSVPAGDSIREITALLIRYRSPMAAVQLPRIVNRETQMQAASPAFEIARLFSIVGIGVDVLRAFAFVLVGISALSIFIALYNSLRERKADLAVMRTMGARRIQLLGITLLEGMVLTFVGTVCGILFAHLILFMLPVLVAGAGQTGVSGWVFTAEEGMILVGSLLLGALCASIPAWMAYRTDISQVLATHG